MSNTKKKKRKTRLLGTDTMRPCFDCKVMKNRFTAFKPRWAGCVAHRTSNGRRYFQQGCADCAALVNGVIRQPRCIQCDKARTKKRKAPKAVVAPTPETVAVVAPTPEPVAVVAPTPEPVAVVAPTPEPDPVVEVVGQPEGSPESVKLPEPEPEPKAVSVQPTSAADILRMLDEAVEVDGE